MISQTEFVITLVGTIFASSGFWAFLTYVLQSRKTKESAEAEMIRGLGHDRIIFLGTKYLEKGSLTREEYDTLYNYLYVPYLKLGGNGVAKKVMDQVEKLPIADD